MLGGPIANEQTLKGIEDQIMIASKTNKQNEINFNNLRGFTINLYDGYMNNLNVIVDISGIMLQYTELINVLMKYLDELKATSFNITPEKLSFLQAQTQSYMARMNKFFNEDHAKLIQRFEAHNINTEELINVKRGYNQQSGLQDDMIRNAGKKGGQYKRKGT